MCFGRFGLVIFGTFGFVGLVGRYGLLGPVGRFGLVGFGFKVLIW